METYKIRKSSRDSPSRLLLSLSCGISSIILLNILNNHLEHQLQRQPRTGYKLIVVLIDTSLVHPADPKSSMLDAVKDKYPIHEYIARPLSDILKVAPEMKTLMQDLIKSSDDQTNDTINSDHQIIEEILRNATSATARVDIINTLKMRLIAETAKEQNCETVLWGDSTTRLAEKTLAAAAKGKGAAIPLLLADGPSPYGIDFRFPLRDILKSEISSFHTIVVPHLESICMVQNTPVRISASAKNTTIDDLMTQYFESVETGYPSIISNVVKTSSKLDSSGLKLSSQPCTFCGLPKESQLDKFLCSDCKRALPKFSDIT
jgi:cytoplasmic tRNA 2-thiolation protein 2